MVYAVYFGNLLVTVLAEGAAAYLLSRRWRLAYISLLCNLLTNPAVNLLLHLWVRGRGPGAYLPALCLLEGIAVVAEAAVYRLLAGLGKGRALGLSLLLNALSLGAGALLQRLF